MYQKEHHEGHGSMGSILLSGDQSCYKTGLLFRQKNISE